MEKQGGSNQPDEMANQMNYNTITSLAALKDLLEGDVTENLENDAFFQHYFMNYCNNLPSRNTASPLLMERRRLSECREEDEDENDQKSSPKHEDKALHDDESSDGKEKEVQGPKRKFIVTKTTPEQKKVEKVLPTGMHTVHFGSKGAESSKPNVRSIFESDALHKDKQYFDSSLIGIKSPAETPSSKVDDVWIKRPEPKPTDDLDAADSSSRPRAGSWSSQSKSDKAKIEKQKKKEKEAAIKRENEERRKQIKEQRRRDKEMTASTHSVDDRRSSRSSSQENKTEEDSHAMYQHTIHGTSGVSRRPALFNALFNKKSDSKKQPSLMQQMKAFMGSKPKTPSATPTPTTTPNSETNPLPNQISPKVRDGSAHPYAGSDARCYHTITAGQTRRPSAMAKVMDIFRAKPSTPNPSDAASRKARALANQQFANTHIRRSLDPTKRRSSLGTLPLARHRASDASIDPYHAAILFRDARGLPVVDPFLEKMTDLEKSESQIFVKFFKYHKCYDLIPTSAKLVIIDTLLPVKKVFFAFVYNGVRAAPLWDSNKHRFVGMVTVTDFIKILQMYYKNPNAVIDELEEHNLDTWRMALKGSVLPLISIGPDASLYDAIKTLVTNKIHRLPVLDTESGDILYILTHKRIMKFLFLYINELPRPEYLNMTIGDLKLGCFDAIETATEETTIIEALKKFVDRRISALPVVDSEGRLKDIYAKFDVINLAAEKTYNNLDISLKNANEHRNEWFEGVEKCKLDESLFTIMERIVRTEVHRLVVVDDDNRVIGVISLSDILDFLVLRPKTEFLKILNDIKVALSCNGDEIKQEPHESFEKIGGSLHDIDENEESNANTDDETKKVDGDISNNEETKTTDENSKDNDKILEENESVVEVDDDETKENN